jgi:hypothetical protein
MAVKLPRNHKQHVFFGLGVHSTERARTLSCGGYDSRLTEVLSSLSYTPKKLTSQSSRKTQNSWTRVLLGKK